MGKNVNAWFGGFKRLITDESLGETLGIIVGSATKQLHILDIDDVDLDLALSADSYPTLYIHGSASATEYIRMYTDSTDAHFNVVGANLDIDVPASAQVAIQVDNADEYVFNATTLNMGSNTITNSGDITLLDGGELSGTNTIINSVNALGLEIAGAELLSIDDAAITLWAGSAAVGTDVYIAAQAGGTGAVYGGPGADIHISAGDGGVSTVGTGAQGGDLYLTAGTASAVGGTGAITGSGGNVILQPGEFGGTTTAPGYVQILGSASYAVTGTGSILHGGTQGPAEVGSLAIVEWLKIQTDTGTTRYIPCYT